MKCDNLQRYEVRADYDAGTIDVPCDNDKYGKYFLVDDVMEAIAELKQTIDELVGVKKSAEQILQNLLDCGLIKEWYFNGKFNAVLKDDDPHMQIAELKHKLVEKDKEIALLKERICNGDVSRSTWIDDCIAKDNEIEELKQKLENVQASMYADLVDANMENRRLKRALWLARAERAKTEHLSKIMYSTLYRDFIAKWVNIERKCRAKAEEYK